MLLLTELPQLASNPASPIRMRVDNRFMYRTYRIVIQLGLLVADSGLTKAGFKALSWPVFWLIAYWKILLGIGGVAVGWPESIRYIALFSLATATNDGVEQPLPQSNGEAEEIGMPLTVVVEPKTSVGSPAFLPCPSSE